MGVASHGLLKSGLVLHANDDQRVRFCGGVRVLQGAFVRGVIALDENLLEWQIVTNESVNPVFVLQHDDSSVRGPRSFTSKGGVAVSLRRLVSLVKYLRFAWVALAVNASNNPVPWAHDVTTF